MMCLNFIHVFLCLGFMEILGFFLSLSLFGQMWEWGRALHLKGVRALGGEAWCVLSIQDPWGWQELDLGTA